MTHRLCAVAHRCPTHRVATLAEVAGQARAAGAATLIADAEPMLARWDDDEQALAAGIERLAEALAEQGAAANLVVATNSVHHAPVPSTPSTDHVRVIGARKPWNLDHYAHCERPLAVVGDQPLTDGLLAWRLGATYLRWAGSTVAERPMWPRIQLAVARLIAPLFHERDRS